MEENSKKPNPEESVPTPPENTSKDEELKEKTPQDSNSEVVAVDEIEEKTHEHEFDTSISDEMKDSYGQKLNESEEEEESDTEISNAFTMASDEKRKIVKDFDIENGESNNYRRPKLEFEDEKPEDYFDNKIKELENKSLYGYKKVPKNDDSEAIPTDNKGRIETTEEMFKQEESKKPETKSEEEIEEEKKLENIQKMDKDDNGSKIVIHPDEKDEKFNKVIDESTSGGIDLKKFEEKDYLNATEEEIAALSDEEKKYLQEMKETYSDAYNQTDYKEVVKTAEKITEYQEKLQKIESREIIQTEFHEEEGNDEESSKVEIQNELPTKESEEKKDDKKEETPLEKIIEKPTYYGGRNSKNIERYHSDIVSEVAKSIANIVVSDIDAYKTVKYNPFDSNDQNLMLEATEQLNDKRVKVALMATGINVVMRNFGYYEQSHIITEYYRLRAISDDPNNKMLTRNEAYYRYRLLTIMTLYAHIEYITTLQGRKYRPTYEEFIRMVKYCDLEQLFYAAFVATHVDINKFEIQCKNPLDGARDEENVVDICGHKFIHQTDNASLQYTLNKKIKFDDMLSIRRGFKENQQLSESLENFLTYCNQSYKRNPTSMKHVFFQRAPTLNDVLGTFAVLIAAAKEKDRTTGQTKYFLNYYFGNFDAPLYGSDEDVYFERTFLRMVASTYKAKLFTVDTSDLKKVKGYYILMDVDTEPKDYNGNPREAEIAELKIRLKLFDKLYNLPKADTLKLMNNSGFRSLSNIQSVSHFISNIVCPKCGKPIEAVKIIMEEYFFFQITEAS